MKTNLKFFVLLLTIGTFTFTACQKEDTDPPQETQKEISEEEAVDIVEGALAFSSEGVAQEASDAAKVSDEYAEKTVSPCGMTFDSTVVRAIDNAYITAEYSTLWEWTVFCNDLDFPVSLEFHKTTEGDYETTRMLSSDSAEGLLTVDNLLSGPNYIINGTYLREGSQTSKVHNQNTFNSTISITIDDLNLDKGSKKIESGIASFTLTGEVEGGQSFEIEGDIIFTGNASATVIINGNSYQISL